MKKIFFIFSFVLLMAAGCNKVPTDNKNTTSKIDDNTPSKTNSAQTDFSNWKTFINDVDGYTLKYPEKFTLKKTDKLRVNNSTSLYYSATFAFPNRLGTPGTIYTSSGDLVNAKQALLANNYKEISSSLEKINGLDIVVSTIQHKENKEDISKVAYINQGNSLLIFSFFEVYTKDFNNILSTFQIKPLSNTSQYQILKNLTDWKEEDYTDWQLYNHTNEDEHRKNLNIYGVGGITMLLKYFNNYSCVSDCSSEKTEQASLLTSIKKTLSDNGWKETLWTNEPGSYNDYLFVKNNRPLVLVVGTRDAVKGGMYIGLEFFK